MMTQSEQFCHIYGHGWLVPMYWPRLVRKGRLTLRLTYHSTTIMLIFAPMLFSIPQMCIGMEVTSQENPVIPLVQTIY